MNREPARQQDQLHRHRRHVRPRRLAIEREQDAREHIRFQCAAARQDCLARAYHVRRIDVVADHLQREIRLHRRTDIERAAVIQRPAAVIGLDAAQIDADLVLQLQVRRLRQMMHQQHIFRRDRGIGLELEHPMAIVALTVEQRLGCAADRRFDGGPIVLFDADLVHRRHYTAARASANSAALWPDLTAPSMVAGRPVAVQSPARNRLDHWVFAGARLAACSGVAAKVARRSFTICHSGIGAVMLNAVATCFQTSAISASRSISTRRSAPLMVVEMRSGKEKIHSAVPPMTPSISGAPFGAGILKCALTMARKSSGALICGSNSLAAHDGTATTTVSPRDSGTVLSGNSSATALLSSSTMRRSRCPN